MNKKSRLWLQRMHSWLCHTPETKEDLIKLLRDAHTQALIDAETLAMIESVMVFSKMKVRDIMLPKQQMICIPEDMPLQAIITIVNQCGHSRFPVIGDTPDTVMGILHAKDMLRYQTPASIAFDIHDLVREAPIVPESKRLDLLLSEFRVNRNHMAIVVDEYGLVSGFITLEDLIEQIVGDIEDEFDIDEEAYVKVHQDDHYIIKAHTPVEVFNEQLHAQLSSGAFATIGGVVMGQFGHLPKRGESITIAGFTFNIISADARRIKLLSCRDDRPQDS